MESIADPALAAWLDGIRTGESVQPSLETIRLLRKDRARPPGPELARVTDVTIPGRLALRARLYRSSAGIQPLTVFVHGGGFVFGGLESHDRLCRRLALLANTAVLAVDYRLAPEHAAPAAVDDVVRALAWVADGPGELGPVRPGVGLAGDSAGGLIAFLAADRLAGNALQPQLLLLAYPNADLALGLPSAREKAEGWGLSVRDLTFFISQWVPAASPEMFAEYSPLAVAAVAVASGRRSTSVRTLLATAEHDPLRDEGQLLAETLVRGGTDVDYVAHPGLVHGFLTLDTVSPAARQAGDALLRRYGTALRRVSDAKG
ncbi:MULTISPECIES: alpha/beta hydrolase fold domain-containing protein [unclassified Arthrobacter]|uniref:alpha/beta hydrolase fold domain-containing protein n=1 Tax=unclassified Arthrobacter TaxID=235627 RepID=UPI001D14407C|nr:MULTISPECIES: alpha/beta hydrolase fold domain-containing protein [unclassified Arthrobacter]MCC3290809.1 alpha/beta hydrolase [Arthrobacter sp. zg-Y1110]MCC3301802.1 alpha/beta hydrolase [Arthrobacter sp. zg-Y895]UWX86225.1 alpha/beta hydrolase [Arthrobacter sp. zg-Y1110]